MCCHLKANWLVISSVQLSCSVVSNPLWPRGLQHARPPCPSPTPGVYPNPCPLSQWCHPTISSSVVPFSSCLQSFPASGSFQMIDYMVIKSTEIINLKNSLLACLKNFLSNFMIYLPCSLKKKTVIFPILNYHYLLFIKWLRDQNVQEARC